MRVLVLVKEVPDTYGPRILNLQTGLAERTAGDVVPDEIGERALEVALAHRDAQPTAEVTVMSVGPDAAAASIRKGLAMGADAAVHIADPDLHGADLQLTARVLAAAARRAGFDLVIAGNQSTDGSGGVLPAMLAELLGVPALTALSTVTIGDDAVSGTRVLDDGVASVSAPLPAVISITESLPDARFPNFKGIMAAKKKPYETLSLADLGVDAGDAEIAHSVVVAISEKPPRSAGVKIVDGGDAGEQVADFLARHHLS